MNNLLVSALAIAAKAKHVFPCAADKKPLTSNGFKAATTDPQVITRWWNQNPQANIGMPTGSISGVVVLDVDVDKEKALEGEKSLAELVSRYGALPETLTVRTPRSGRHIYFQHPGGRVPCSTGKVGVGLDVRGDGGYILLPPSQTTRGRYEYVSRVAAAPIPDWLLELMIRSHAEPKNPAGKPPGTASLSSDEEERIRSALARIPASIAHDEWVRIGMALHSWDGVRGRLIWREWSQTCSEKFKERDLESSWRSFKPNGGVSLGTLFELAKGYGWCPKSGGPAASGNSKPSQSDAAELTVPDWPAPARLEAFHGVLGEYVRRLEPHTEADPMAILVQLLVGFGNVLGRSAYFEVEADKHYLNLNAVVVGNSAKARKGTSWGHVKRLLMQIDSSWPSPLTGLSTGEGLIHQVRDPVVKTNKKGEEEVEDEGQNDKRLLAVETEFGRMLQCASRDGNTISAVIRQAFDTGDLRVATKSSPERATNAHISIIGHITTIELNQLLTKSDSANGLANRFLWMAAKRSKLLPEGGDANSMDFRDIRNKLSEAVVFARQTGKLKLDAEARELWRMIYTALSAELPGLLGAVCSRAEAIVMRMATLLAVTDWSPVITSAHLKAALAIWDYCAASAKFIFGNTLGNPVAEKVLAALKQAGEVGLSLAAIYDHFSGHLDKDELHGALKDLHGQGLARFEKVKTSGRPGQIWFATRINGEKSVESVNGMAGPTQNTPPTDSNLSSLNSQKSQPEEWEVEI